MIEDKNNNYLRFLCQFGIIEKGKEETAKVSLDNFLEPSQLETLTNQNEVRPVSESVCCDKIISWYIQILIYKCIAQLKLIF